MTLDKYNQKRNFNFTEEPKGESVKSKNDLIFIVQKHAASHLHYDFRLEINGVLKSWAIPKGPSMNPNDKRLAIMVEDHPFSYKDFEGTIPEGNYGAGNVIVWDNGTYTLPEEQSKVATENKLKTDLEKGHIRFILNGKKLKGEFSLVKLNNKKDEQKFIGKTLLSQLSEAFRNLLTSPFLFLIMLQGIAIFVLSRIAQVNLYQPILENKQYGIESFGPVMSAMTVFEALGSAKPGWIRKWMSDLNAVFFLTAIMAISIASMIFGGKALVFILFCVFSYATGLSFPIQRQLLNDAITDSRFRATLLSIESIIDRAVCAWTASLMGAFLATGRLNQFLILSGEVTLGFLVLVALGLQFTSVQKKQKN